MATLIHARHRKGQIRYRLWSTTTDSYLTTEMSEYVLRKWLYGDALQNAIRDADQRIQRASKTGTSSLMDAAVDLCAPWDKRED